MWREMEEDIFFFFEEGRMRCVGFGLVMMKLKLWMGYR